MKNSTDQVCDPSSKVYTDPETWDKEKQAHFEKNGKSYKEYTEKGFGFIELGFPLYEKPKKPIHPITGDDLDPVGDAEWREKTIHVIKELAKFPEEDRIRIAALVNYCLDFIIDPELLDNIIKYYEIKAAKPKRR